MAEKTVVRIGDEALAACEALAEEKDISLSEAVERLVLTGHKRRRALSKWSKAAAKKLKAEGKSAAPKKAKKAKASAKKSGVGKLKPAKKKKAKKSEFNGASESSEAMSRAEEEAARLADA
jgi:hypothetical protein